MGKPRRSVRFPNRANSNGDRRSSFSDVSEDGHTPTKSRPAAVLRNISEVRCRLGYGRCCHVAKPSRPFLYCLSLTLTPPPLQKQTEYEKKKQNFITRTFWTFVMIGGFFAALFMGHIYMIIIVTAVQIVSFSEVIAIANVPSRERQLSSSKSLNWYWLATTMYFLYGESVIYYFKHIVLVDKVLLPLATHHRFISFILYVFGMFWFHFLRTLLLGSLADRPHYRRLCFLCHFSQCRSLQVSVYTVRMDTYGPLLDRGPGPLRYEQHL